MRREAAKTRWKCTSREHCLQWLHAQCPPLISDLDQFHVFLRDMQERWGCSKTCAARRSERVPLQLRDLYRRLRATTAEAERQMLQREAWLCLTNWITRCQTTDATAAVKKGKTFSRSKIFFPVSALAGEDGVEETEQDKWLDPVYKEFASKCACRDAQHRVLLLDFIFRTETCPVGFYEFA